MGKFKILIILAVSIVAILAVCLAVYVVVSSLADRQRAETFNDSDLIPTRVVVPVESNAFWTLLKATNELYWPEELSDRLDDLSNNTNWDDSLAAEVLEKNRSCLSLFDEARRQPCLLVPEPNPFVQEYSYLAGWRAISRVEAIQVIALFREGNERDACDSAFKIVEFGQRVENSGGPIIHFLVGSAIKTVGVRHIQQMIPQTALPETNLVGLIDRLDQYRANKEGLTNTFKVEYQINRKFLDALAAGKYQATVSETNPMTFSFYDKLLFSPMKTKMKFSREDRVMRDNISKPFDEIPWAELPVVETNTPVWRRLISGNALGDILFGMTEYSFKPFASRVSQENVDVTATQLLVALKLYKMRHGRLPESLSGLVPEFFPQVPTDEFDGKPFRYLPAQKLIYSVGPDLKDSGGDGRRKNSKAYDLPYEIEF
jgi:hypothetical protein